MFFQKFREAFQYFAIGVQFVIFHYPLISSIAVEWFYYSRQHEFCAGEWSSHAQSTVVIAAIRKMVTQFFSLLGSKSMDVDVGHISFIGS